MVEEMAEKKKNGILLELTVCSQKLFCFFRYYMSLIYFNIRYPGPCDRYSGGRRHRGGGNIERHLRMWARRPTRRPWRPPTRSAWPVIATTFAPIAVFPAHRLQERAGRKVLRAVRLTAVFAVFAPLVVARMLTPMMAVTS